MCIYVYHINYLCILNYIPSFLLRNPMECPGMLLDEFDELIEILKRTWLKLNRKSRCFRTTVSSKKHLTISHSNSMELMNQSQVLHSSKHTFLTMVF